MRAANPLAPPLLPVVDGSTTYPQPSGGGECWSSILNVRMEWSGSRWRVASVPGALSFVADGDTVVIPFGYILNVDPDFYSDGDCVADGDVISMAVS